MLEIKTVARKDLVVAEDLASPFDRFQVGAAMGSRVVPRKEVLGEQFSGWNGWRGTRDVCHGGVFL